jgi:hypothetical protein
MVSIPNKINPFYSDSCTLYGLQCQDIDRFRSCCHATHLHDPEESVNNSLRA